MKPAFRSVDLFFGGGSTAGNVARDHANCLPPENRRKFQDALQRVSVIDRRSPRRAAANGCSRISISILTGARAEPVQRVAYCGVPTGPPRIEHCGEDSISGETEWIDGVAHSVSSPRRLAGLQQRSPAIIGE
jgi:hypothetical protein